MLLIKTCRHSVTNVYHARMDVFETKLSCCGKYYHVKDEGLVFFLYLETLFLLFSLFEKLSSCWSNAQRDISLPASIKPTKCCLLRLVGIPLQMFTMQGWMFLKQSYVAVANTFMQKMKVFFFFI